MKAKQIVPALLLTALCCACQSNQATISSSNAPDVIDLSANIVSDNSPSANDAEEAPAAYEELSYTLSGNLCETFSVPDQTTTYDEDTTTTISISGNTVDVVGNGVNVSGSQIIITEEGSYLLSGTLEEGQVYIRADENAKVHLIFQDVTLHCSTSAPLFIDSADKVIITLQKDSVNTLTDGAAYLDDAATGCIFSRCDLSINGEGTLNIIGNYNNAISCKNDLKIMNGIYNLTAENNGIKGNDSVSIVQGTVTIESKDDGIKVDNDVDEDKGFILLVDASVSITADNDCLQSPRAVVILGGNVMARSFDQIINCDGYTIGTEDYITEWM